MKSASLLSLISLFGLCYGHAQYQRYIPNGNRVPNPCTEDTSDVWPMVGHIKRPWRRPDTILNPFGMYFKVLTQQYNIPAEQVWQYLCQIDSDGDGRTNGEELGDINCNGTLDTNAILSHPGIAETNIPVHVIGTYMYKPTDQAKRQYCA